MLCLFLIFHQARRAILLRYPSLRHLTKKSLYQNSVWLLCGFTQISLILLSVLLKLGFLESLHVAYFVATVALVGGKYIITNLGMLKSATNFSRDI